MNKEVAKAFLKRTVCDFGLWLCRFDEGDKEAEKDKQGYQELRAKHDEVIQKWKHSKQSG